MTAEHYEVEADVIARLGEVCKMIKENAELQTEFIRSAYAVFMMEMHDLGYLEDASYLFFMRTIHPTYYWELLTHDEPTQKMYLRCEYEARTFGAHCDLFPKNESADTVPYNGG